MRVDNISNDFTKAIGAISDSKDLRDNFRDFLDFQLFFFCSNPSSEQVEWFNKELVKKRELYTKAMLLLGDGSERYNDLLGEFFMRVDNISNDFTKAIGAISDSKDLRDNFRDFLDFQLFFFCSNPSSEQVEWFNKELVKKRELYTKAMLLLGDGSERYNDLLGEFFYEKCYYGKKWAILHA